MQIKSVAVLGAGAVGSYVIWGLSSRKDIRLAVIAEGPRAERLKQQGITINGTTYRPEEWFSVDRDTAVAICEKIVDGSITQYRMDNVQGVVVRKG